MAIYKDKRGRKQIIGITGAHGFIGSHYCAMVEKQEDILLQKFDKTRFNLMDFVSLRDFVADKDTIIHLGGLMRASNNELISVNTLGTVNLLEAITKYSATPNVKMIFASSLQVYGFTRDLKYQKESAPLKPTNIYGFSKKFAEEIIASYCQKGRIKSVILRLANVYGPGGRPFFNSVVATFAYLAANRGVMTVEGSGNAARDFIYISDAVRALKLAASYRSEEPVSIFNICTGQHASVNDLLKIIFQVTGEEPHIQNREGKPDDFLLGNPNKAKRCLGFQSLVNLKEGFEETISSFRKTS